MYLVLREVEKKDNQQIKSLMFDTMFCKPNETFMRMIEGSKEPVYMLEEDADGDEIYYGFHFKRVCSEG